MKLLPIALLATTTTATAQQIGSSINSDGNINQLAHKLQQRKKSHQHSQMPSILAFKKSSSLSHIHYCKFSDHHIH